MLDEKALRRETFSEGPSVRLLDGQLWTFPKPYLSLFAQIGADGKVESHSSLTYGTDYADRLDELVEAEDGYERTCLYIELAAGLLLRNYDLGNKALRRLIATNTDGQTDPEMWPAILAVLLGRDVPKPSAVGSESASPPTA